MVRCDIIIHELTLWIEDNIRQPLTIEDVAQRSGYSKWHLQRMFHRIMNITLANYIRNKKLELAADDLTHSNEAIVDISFKYGYDSQQSFSRSFSRKYKIPPATFRRLEKIKLTPNYKSP